MKTENKLLEYNKLILEKVSFDKRIFWKEYRKGVKNLTKPESIAFRFWVINRFGFQGKTASKIYGVLENKIHMIRES